MSTLDQEPRLSGGRSSPLHEPRVDPGTNAVNPPRVNMSPRLPTAIPRGMDHTKADKRMPVKR